jgi:arylsulfatase A-like enzyme/N-acetylneuraminic acid mutarotase
MADDLGWGDVAYNGNKVVQTPYLDAMSRAAIRLDRFYAAAPVCSPTRGSCLTGRHPFRYGITWAGETPLDRNEITIAEALRTAGYATGHFGKWHVGGLSKTVKQSYFEGPVDPATYSPPWENGFDESFSTESMMPTYNPYYHLGGEFGTPEYRHLQTEPVAKGQRNGGFRWRDVYWTGPGQLVDEWLDGDDSKLIVDRALDFIGRQHKSGTPSLSLIWFHSVHTPLVASDADRVPYADQPMQAQHWYGATTAMDRQVGRLRKYLRDRGLADNTILWFCSDNGPSYIHDFNSAGPFRGKKSELFEGGLRVPAIVEWPGRLKGKRSLTAPISTSDFYPTLLKAAGVPVPDNQPTLDGEDVMPLLDGSKTKRRYPIAFQAPVKKKNSSDAEVGALQIALSGERFKLITMNGGKRWQLYDLDNDRGETTDVAAEHPDIVQAMQRDVENWMASCRRSAQGDDYRETIDDQFSFLPDFPDSIGVAGSFVGVHNGALIVAGGANFAEKPLIDGGSKVWHDQVFVLEPNRENWDRRFRLRRPLAYGGSASTSKGIVIVGGSDSERDYADVSLLSWNASEKTLKHTNLSALPVPTSKCRAVAINDRVYVLSGQSSRHPANDLKKMWVMDLNDPPQELRWTECSSWPGKPRANMTVAAQEWQGRECLFLVAGVHETKDNGDTLRDFLTDAYRYDPASGKWSVIESLPAWDDPRPIPDKARFAKQPASATAAAAIGIGDDLIYVFGGTTGRYILLPDGTMRPFADRPFNPRRVLKYDIANNRWSHIGQMPVAAIVTSAVRWNGQVVIPSGETKPGIRTPRAQALRISNEDRR